MRTPLLALIVTTTLVTHARAQTVLPAPDFQVAYPALPAGVHSAASTVARVGSKNHLFVIGGSTTYGSGFPVTAAVMRSHSPVQWSQEAPLPLPRWGACASTSSPGPFSSDRIYVFGGSSSPNDVTNTLQIFDPNAQDNEWSSVLAPAPMPTARRYAQAVTMPDRLIHVFGGEDASGTPLNVVEVYDPAQNAWVASYTMLRPRTRFAATLTCSDEVFLFGGRSLQSGSLSEPMVDVLFDSTQGLWQPDGTVPNLTGDLIGLAGAVARDGRIFAIGGGQLDWSASSTSVYSWLPGSQNTIWTVEPYLTVERQYAVARGLGRHVFSVGGQGLHYVGQWSWGVVRSSVQAFGPFEALLECDGIVPEGESISGGPDCSDTLLLPTEATIESVVVSGGTPSILEIVAAPGESVSVLVTPSDDLTPAALVTGACGGALDRVTTDADGRVHAVASNSAAGGSVLVQLGVAAGTAPSTYHVMVRGTDSDLALGEPYCYPAASNSTGKPSRIMAFGFPGVETNALRLEVDGLPEQSFGYFLVSRNAGTITPPGSSGTLCLGGPDIGRFAGNVLNAGATGFVELGVDLTSLPGNPPQAAQTGDTWRFAYWHRDAGAAGVSTSNFSNAIAVSLR